jgi:peptidoglycan/LPS O-acetylase OafA/YrhL
MTTSASNRVSLDALTSFRFLAAFGVLIAHNGEALKPFMPQMVENFAMSGGTGVLFFFILSGFILVYANRKKDLTLPAERSQFFYNRFARIAPLYYFALALGFVNLFIKGFGGESLFHVISATGLRLTFLHAWSPWHVLNPEWLTASWTLSVEAFFYAFFPFLFPVLKFKKWQGYLWLGLVMILAVSFQIYFSKQLTQNSLENKFYYFNPIHYGYTFVLGMCCGRLYLEHKEFFKSYALLLTLVGGGVCVVTRLIYWGPGHYASYLGNHLGSAILILGLAELLGPLGKFFAAKGLVLLGEASYALYLLHGPVYSAYNMISKRLPLPPIVSSVSGFVVYSVLTILASIASFYWIETPAKNWLLNRRQSRLTSK